MGGDVNLHASIFSDLETNIENVCNSNNSPKPLVYFIGTTVGHDKLPPPLLPTPPTAHPRPNAVKQCGVVLMVSCHKECKKQQQQPLHTINKNK